MVTYQTWRKRRKKAHCHARNKRTYYFPYFRVIYFQPAGSTLNENFLPDCICHKVNLRNVRFSDRPDHRRQVRGRRRSAGQHRRRTVLQEREAARGRPGKTTGHLRTRTRHRRPPALPGAADEADEEDRVRVHAVVGQVPARRSCRRPRQQGVRSARQEEDHHVQADGQEAAEEAGRDVQQHEVHDHAQLEVLPAAAVAQSQTEALLLSQC